MANSDEEKVSSPRRSDTPVTDNFATNFSSIIDEDILNGFHYFNREIEINTILKFLLKKGKQHIAIIGEYGTGRETLIKTVVKKILDGHSNFSLSDLRFLKLDYDSIVAGTRYRGQYEERVKAVIHEIEESQNIVLYIEDIYSQFGGTTIEATVNLKDGRSYDSVFDPSKQLLNILKNKYIKVITCLTSEEADKLFRIHNNLRDLFNIIRISPTNKTETHLILKSHIQRFSKFYSVVIPESLIDEIIEYSNLYFVDEFQPSKSLFILEDICANIELDRFSKPTGVIKKYKYEYDAFVEEISKIGFQKIKAVKAQDFVEAANFRDKEKNLLQELEGKKSELSNLIKGKKVVIKSEDIVAAIHNLTGIEIEKIKNKEQNLIKFKQNVQAEYSGLPKYEFLQTQSILHGHQISIKNGVAFVLIPHNKEFDELFYHFIKPSLEHHGLTVLKGDNIYEPGNILSQVWAQIRTAEVIVADVSGQNANVIFELGLCYGIQRCPILLTRNPIELPFNIRNLRYIQYENSVSGANKLSIDLKTSVGEFLSAVRTDNT